VAKRHSDGEVTDTGGLTEGQKGELKLTDAVILLSSIACGDCGGSCVSGGVIVRLI
jgi:hypothetical protein